MKIEKSLTEKEINSLNKRLKQLGYQHKSQIKFLIVWTVLAIVIGIYASFKLKTKSEHYLLLATVIVYILIGLWAFLETLFKHKKERNNINFVLSTNKVTLIKVVSNEYIELSEKEDEGVYYLFQLTDNKALSFGGQDFYPDEIFPSTDFEIAICYGPKGEIVLFDTYIYGKKLLPKTTIEGQRKWDLMAHAHYPDPEKFTIIDGQLSDFV